MVVVRQKMLCLGKVVVFLAKVNPFGKKWLYSEKIGSIRAQVVLFGQKWLYLVKDLVFGQKWL